MVSSSGRGATAGGDGNGASVYPSVENVVEGFAVETLEQLIFTVKGLLHPPDRLIAYLRYAPDEGGCRCRDGQRFRRFYRFDEQVSLLEAHYPHYLHRDAVFGVRLQSVAGASIGRVYDPRLCLAEMRNRGPADPTEQTVLELDRMLQDAAEMSPGDLGISGSVMVNLHQSDSDMDLVVYGEGACRRLHSALKELLDADVPRLRRPAPGELAALHAAHRVDTPLSFEAFAGMQRRKVNELRFAGRETFFRFVKLPSEIQRSYGDCHFETIETATISARVTDDREAIFTPCRFGIEDVTFLDGPAVGDLRDIVSFRGRFSDQAVSGEWIEARGSVERVMTHAGTVHRRLVVGGQPGDYITLRSRESSAAL